VLDDGNVLEGVARHGDDVGVVAGLELADLTRPAEQSRAVEQIRLEHGDGQLQSIVRCDEEVDQSKYGLSSFRWYAVAASPESGAEREKGVQPSFVEGKHSGTVRFGGISSKGTLTCTSCYL